MGVLLYLVTFKFSTIQSCVPTVTAWYSLPSMSYRFSGWGGKSHFIAVYGAFTVDRIGSHVIGGAFFLSLVTSLWSLVSGRWPFVASHWPLLFTFCFQFLVLNFLFLVSCCLFPACVGVWYLFISWLGNRPPIRSSFVTTVWTSDQSLATRARRLGGALYFRKSAMKP
jgi:hypothetical protein